MTIGQVIYLLIQFKILDWGGPINHQREDDKGCAAQC